MVARCDQIAHPDPALGTSLGTSPGTSLGTAIQLDAFAANWRLERADVQQLLGMLSDQAWHKVGDLRVRFPADRRRLVAMTILWLAKYGVIQWRDPAGLTANPADVPPTPS